MARLCPTPLELLLDTVTADKKFSKYDIVPLLLEDHNKPLPLSDNGRKTTPVAPLCPFR